MIDSNKVIFKRNELNSNTIFFQKNNNKSKFYQSQSSNVLGTLGSVIMT